GQPPGQFAPRQCPIHGTDMVEHDFHGVLIDSCRTCRGTWLDATELESIAEVAARRIAQQKIDLCGRYDPTSLRWADNFYSQPTPHSPRHCPVDGASMILCHRGGIEIDYCPVCRGIWCDTGELQAIIHRIAQRLALQVTELAKSGELQHLPLPMRVDQGPCTLNHDRAKAFHRRLQADCRAARGSVPASIQHDENINATKFLLRHGVKFIGGLPADESLLLQIVLGALKFWRF
ncbi:MAG: zf-TFIIB domain-containing protein, partial [Pseudomonadota bacterium]